MRLPIILALLATAGLAAPAAAQRVDPRLRAVLACAAVTDAAARLACFDGAIAPLEQAASSGALEGRSLGPKALTGTIRSMRGQGYDRLLVQLENNDRWVLMLEGNERLPKAGDSVTATRGALGNWFFKVQKGQTFSAKFLGPPEARRP